MSKLQLYRENALDLFASLPPRDRALAIGLIIILFFGGIGLSMKTMNASLKNGKSDVERLERNLELIQILQNENATLQSQVASIEEALVKNATTDLSAFLEQAATKAGFNPKEKNMQIREQNTSNTTDRLQEKVYSVNLSQLNTEEMAKFFFQTESSGYPLQIKNSSIKRRKRGEEVTLDVTLDIAAYKMLEAE